MTASPDADRTQAWLNGRYLSFADAALPVWDLGVVAGASVSEMTRTYRHIPFRIADHLRRFISSCRQLDFPLPYSSVELAATIEELVRRNTALLDPDDDLGVVLFATAGSNPTYIGAARATENTVGIHTFPLPFDQWFETLRHGVRLTIPAIRQVPAESWPVTLKTRNRLHWWLADRQAAQREPGSRALLLDVDGLVTETSTACFHAVIDGGIVTPAGAVLESLSCRLVSEIAALRGIPFAQRSLHHAELAGVVEAFVTSSPAGVFPVRRLQGRDLPVAAENSVTTQILLGWSQLVGLDMAGQIRHRGQLPARS